MKRATRVVSGPSYTLYHGRMEDALAGLGRFDHILADPPYQYLKGHAFDRPFDEALLFETARRVMPDTGFIALFGRGAAFYRWNAALAALGFVFKEELVWDKRRASAPCLAVSRVHETVSLHTRKSGKIRRAVVPYMEHKQFDLESVANDLKRVASAAQTSAGMEKIQRYLREGKLAYNKGQNGGSGVAVQTTIRGAEKAVTTLKAVMAGMREKTILRVNPVHYGQSHPTEKPVRLMERVLALIAGPGDLVLDPFMGSGAAGVACVRTGRRFIGCEIDEGYFETALKRLREAAAQPELDFAEGLSGAL